MNKNLNKKSGAEVFSLGVGGSLYRYFEKRGLLNKLYKRRIITVSLLTWLPLLILTWLGGVVFSGVQVPFIYDIDVHVRFLLVLSMLLYAETIAHDRMHVIVEQFLKCNIIAEEDRLKFDTIFTSTMRFRDSVLAEIILIVLVYTVGHWISKEYLALNVSNWYTVNKGDIKQLTMAGYWYVFVSLPLFQFILLRWYFRIVVWYRFLWQVSRLPLQLNSLHPDRAGGLGFLANSVYALEPFLLAHSVLLSGMIFNRISNTGASISDFHIEIVSVFVFLLIIPLMPLLFFMFKMIKEKRTGTLKYDVFASRYVDSFRQKWITPPVTNHESMLGAQDIQSLADLFNSFEVSNKMRITPFGRSSIVVLVILTALPLLPLILTVIPVEKIVSQILGLIF